MKFYDRLAQTYDYFIDWDTRIKNEDPFYQHLFQERLAYSILDLGCATGGHSLYWADKGFNVIGIDSSKEMIEYARRQADTREIDAEFQCLQITDFSSSIQQRFDAIICAGNTLSHLTTLESLQRLFQESFQKALKKPAWLFFTS